MIADTLTTFKGEDEMATFTNVATLFYNGSVINSNVVTGELVQVLTVDKTAVTTEYTRDSEITYVISLVNSGTTAFTGLTITDDLGAYTTDTASLVPLTYMEGSIRYFVNGALQPAPAVTTTSPLTISGISVPAGGNALIVYQARANQFAPLGIENTVTNTVTVTGGGVSSPLTAEETISASNDIQLAITKALEPVNITENGELTYTFTIQNYGARAVTAEDSVTLQDIFDPILTDLEVTFNGAPWTLPANYTYDPESGNFTTAAGQITVPAATFTQREDGSWAITPGVSTLIVTGTV